MIVPDDANVIKEEDWLKHSQDSGMMIAQQKICKTIMNR